MHTPTQKQLLSLAIPNTLAALAVPIAELVDIAFLGHVSDVNQLSGVVLATVIFDYIFWSLCFLRMGMTGLVAQAVGADDIQEQAALFWRGAILALFLGATLTLLQTPIALLGFSVLAGDSATETAGLAYYYAHIWSAIPTLINFVCIGWLLGRQRSKDVFLISLVWESTNILFDYWFIVINGWGAEGAGYAITIGSWASMFISLVCIYHSWGGIPPIHRESLFDWARTRQVMALNSSILVRTFLLISTLAVFTNISATFGTVALTGSAILMRLWVTFAYVVDGFAVALETLGGTYYGNQNRAALRRSFYMTMRWSAGLTLAFILTYWLGGDILLSILTEHSSVIAHAQKYLPWLLLTLVVGGIAFIYDGLFLGLAKPKLLMTSMLWSCLSFIPFGIIGFLTQSSHWLWAGFAIFITTRAITLSLSAREYLHPEATP